MPKLLAWCARANSQATSVSPGSITSHAEVRALQTDDSYPDCSPLLPRHPDATPPWLSGPRAHLPPRAGRSWLPAPPPLQG